MKIRRIYVPGLLSLIFLFPLLLTTLSRWGIFDKQYVVEVNWYSSEIETPYMQKFPPSKDYINVNLTGNGLTDKVKIEYAKVLLDEMVSKFDTTRGVHITFADTAKYQSFIDILDYCNQQEYLIYAPHENNFWVFNRSKNEEQKKTVSLGPCIIMTPLEYPQNKNYFAWALPYDIDAKLWPIGVLFVLLIIVNFKGRPGR